MPIVGQHLFSFSCLSHFSIQYKELRRDSVIALSPPFCCFLISTEIFSREAHVILFPTLFSEAILYSQLLLAKLNMCNFQAGGRHIRTGIPPEWKGYRLVAHLARRRMLQAKWCTLITRRPKNLFLRLQMIYRPYVEQICSSECGSTIEERKADAMLVFFFSEVH